MVVLQERRCAGTFDLSHFNFSIRDFCAVVVWTEALLWRYLVVVDREFIRDVFCANNCPCWLRSVKMEGCSDGRVVNGKSGGGYIKFVC